MISGVNNQSFGMQRNMSGGGASSKPAVENAPVPTDGVQLRWGEQPAAAAEVPTKAPVRMEITSAELCSQGFRQTMVALASAGIPVEVVLIAEKALNSEPPTQPQASPPAASMNYNQGYIAHSPAQPAPAAPHRTPSYGSD